MTPSRLSRPAAVLLCLTLLPACNNSTRTNDPQPPTHTLVSRFTPGGPVTTDTVPASGYYELFRDGKTVGRFQLKQGDKIGFADAPAKYSTIHKPGDRYAIAAQYEIRIDPTATYEWKQVPFKSVTDFVPRTVY